MFEKVNPCHPDKVADRIAGAIVDIAYAKNENPKIAVEVLIGHERAMVTVETSVDISDAEVTDVVERIAGIKGATAVIVKQDEHLAANQDGAIRCGDNGIFKGTPITIEQDNLARSARAIFQSFPTDGKYILANNRLIICQSNADTPALAKLYPNAVINPLGYWTGGSSVDSGATNRKLGSDMGDGVTGGGLHGKDLSKADVSVNIFCHIWAQRLSVPVQAYCAIGNEKVTVIVNDEKFRVPYTEIVYSAQNFIKELGGFEKFAEWGLI